jgi:hypothetical protein
MIAMKPTGSSLKLSTPKKQKEKQEEAPQKQTRKIGDTDFSGIKNSLGFLALIVVALYSISLFFLDKSGLYAPLEIFALPRIGELALLLLVLLAVVFMSSQRPDKGAVVMKWAVFLSILVFSLILILGVWPDFDPAKTIRQWGKGEKEEQLILPRDTQWQRVGVVQEPQELLRIYEGDEFLYKSPVGFWVIDPQGKKYYHNPSANREEIRSFNFYNVKEEGEIVSIKAPEGQSKFQMSYKVLSKN